MREIRKKIWRTYFDKVESGEKTYEVRLADWGCNEGDVLILEEVLDGTDELTGRSVTKKVGFVGKTKDFTFWTDEEVDKYGYQVISLLDWHDMFEVSCKAVLFNKDNVS